MGGRCYSQKKQEEIYIENEVEKNNNEKLSASVRNCGV